MVENDEISSGRTALSAMKLLESVLLHGTLHLEVSYYRTMHFNHADFRIYFHENAPHFADYFEPSPWQQCPF